MHIHKWTKWSDPYTVKFFSEVFNKQYDGEKQKRTCTRCNEVRTRIVKGK